MPAPPGAQSYKAFTVQLSEDTWPSCTIFIRFFRLAAHVHLYQIGRRLHLIADAHQYNFGSINGPFLLTTNKTETSQIKLEQYLVLLLRLMQAFWCQRVVEMALHYTSNIPFNFSMSQN